MTKPAAKYETIGYIIVTECGPLGFSRRPDCGEEGVLWLSASAVACFKTRGLARKAIKKTLKFADDHHYDWNHVRWARTYPITLENAE